MTIAVRLVRHTEIATAWAGRCYGQSDMGLSRAGLAAAKALASELADWRPETIVHSGLRRTRRLAELVGARAGVCAAAAPAWRERDFGDWEGRSWRTIYRKTGSAMDGMIDDPARFRPGGGETTMELAARANAALAALPVARVLVITHGGPIAAILGTRHALPPRDWLALVPRPDAFCDLSRG